MNPAMNTIMDKLNAMSGQMAELLAMGNRHEVAISELRADLAKVNESNKEKDKIISKHTDQINACEQALRSNSLRIIGLPVTKASTNSDIIDSVYENILLPILSTAKEKGEIESFPTKRFLIDNAFTIPSKSNTSSPVIVKLSSSTVRSLIFSYKKDVLPSTTDPASGRSRPRFGIYEDLTAANFAQFKAISEDPRTTAIWTFNGQIKYRMKDTDTIFRVRSLQDTVDSLAT